MIRILFACMLLLTGIVLCGDAIYMRAKAMLAQVLLERAFAATVASGASTKPWSWADTWPVARIEVTRLGASAVVLHGSSGQALAFGPGHLEGTADPGERGTVVYAAHRDTHFRFLKDVVVGDEIIVVRRDGRRFRYRADRSEIVRYDEAAIVTDGPDRALVLSTCWPFDAITPGPERYLLHATLVEETAWIQQPPPSH